MQHICKYTRWLLLPLLFWPLLAGAQFSKSPQIDEILSEYEGAIDPFCFILKQGNKTLYQQSFFGQDQLDDQILPNTRVRVASASKWLTAAVILALIDEGKLSLDHKVSRYLPQFKGKKGQMTVRSLLCHTSGFPASSIFIKDPNSNLTQSVDSIAAEVNLIAEPNSEFNYGGVSFQVAARIAEVVTKKDWETIFREKITDPCNMPKTDFGKKANKDIGDGAYSTANDYQHFMQMILNRGVYNGKRVLSSKAIIEMMKNQVGDVPIGYTPYKLKSAVNSNRYGLGVWIDREMIGENIATEVSSQGGRGFTPWVNTCKGITAVFSTYSSVTKLQPAIDRVKVMVDDHIEDDCYDRSTHRSDQNDIGFMVEPGTTDALNTYTNAIFELNEDSYVSLRIFDPLGNVVKEIIDGYLKAGKYNMPVDISSLKEGVYFYKLQINNSSETRKLTVKR